MKMPLKSGIGDVLGDFPYFFIIGSFQAALGVPRQGRSLRLKYAREF